MAACVDEDGIKFKSEIEKEEIVPEEGSTVSLPPPSVHQCIYSREQHSGDDDDEMDHIPSLSSSLSSLSSSSTSISSVSEGANTPGKTSRRGPINSCVRINSVVHLGHTACNLCVIQSVKYEFTRRGRYRRKKERYCHYFCHVCWKDVEGRTGLKKDDELLKVNNHVLDGKKPKKVLKIFGKIKERRNDSFELKLKLRRWQVDENEPEVFKRSIVNLKVKLTEIKDTENIDAEVISDYSQGSKVLPRGNVTGVHIGKPYPKVVKLLDKRRQFLRTTEDGKLVGQKIGPDGACQFGYIGWSGRDLTPNAWHWYASGCILSYMTQDGNHLYMTSRLKDNAPTLKFQAFPNAPDPQNPDERFFIEDENGNKRVLRSLIYRDQCLSYKDGEFIMKHVDLDKVKQWNENVVDGCEVDFTDPPNDTLFYKRLSSGSGHVEDNRNQTGNADNNICENCRASQDISTKPHLNGHTCAPNAHINLSRTSNDRERSVTFTNSETVIHETHSDPEKDSTTDSDLGNKQLVNHMSSKVRRSSSMIRQLSTDLETECPRRWWNIFACS